MHGRALHGLPYLMHRMRQFCCQPGMNLLACGSEEQREDLGRDILPSADPLGETVVPFGPPNEALVAAL